jgi:CheY-like chemotaxis protein
MIDHRAGPVPQRAAAGVLLAPNPTAHGGFRPICPFGGASCAPAGGGALARDLPSHPFMETERPAGQHRILLVEDDRLERMNLTLVLGREGFDFDVAANAREAYALLANGPYELVLTDIGLPDGDGIEILHAAKRADAATKVVLVTGSQSSLTQETAKFEGAESLMLKPFALATFLETVRGLVGTHPRDP